MFINDETTVLISNINIKIYKFRIIYIRPTLYIRNKLIKFKIKKYYLYILFLFKYNLCR